MKSVLWLCLHFPKLPLEALIPKPSFGDANLRVVIEASRVVTCDDEVEALGVTTGQSNRPSVVYSADIPCNYSAEITRRNTRRSNA